MNDLKENFSGLLDGDGHSIKNLNMTSTSDVGLFGGVQEGTIRNLKI